MIEHTPPRSWGPDTPRAKAYSYIRFSTPEQAKGSSYQRQIELAQAYARERELKLAETTYTDLGVSAFRQKNAETGALRAFLNAVENGEIPIGSFLLVESLDRLTRSAILAAQGLFLQIVGAGITLVTLADKREYSRDTITGTDLIISIVIMMRGNEESSTKSVRVTDAYERKRKEAANGTATKPFNTPPAWLRWEPAKQAHIAIPERAAVLRSIFKKASAGWGQHRITQWLNERKTPTWGKAQRWRRSYVRALLTNSAMVGTFTPHQKLPDAQGKRSRKPLDPIEGHFPAVVDRELFERVAHRLRATGARGRNAAAAPVSIFAGVIKCAHCGGAITRVVKEGKYAYLVCSKASSLGECKYQAVRYQDVEKAFLRNARVIIRNAPRGPETEELESEIANLDNVVSVLADEARDWADELIREKSAVVRARLREKEAELEGARERLRALRAQKETLARPYVLRRLGALKDALRRKPFSIPEVNKALKEAVSKIVLDPEAGRLAIYWHHASEPTEDVPFFSRHSKVFEDDAQSVANVVRSGRSS